MQIYNSGKATNKLFGEVAELSNMIAAVIIRLKGKANF